MVIEEGQRVTEEEAIRFCKGKIAKNNIPKSISFVKEVQCF
jgi:hypothetical protein